MRQFYCRCLITNHQRTNEARKGLLTNSIFFTDYQRIDHIKPTKKSVNNCPEYRFISGPGHNYCNDSSQANTRCDIYRPWAVTTFTNYIGATTHEQKHTRQQDQTYFFQHTI